MSNWVRTLRAFVSLDALREAMMLDTGWYLATYPDVRVAGINPRLHYLRYGRAEGRRPSARAKIPYLAHSPQSTEVGCLAEQLWAGFARQASPELEALAGAGDGRAAWELALWAFATGQASQARHWLTSAAAPGGEAQKALALLRCGLEGRLSSLSPTDQALLQLNTRARDAALEALNGLLRAHQLDEVELRTPGDGLNLANLQGRTPPQAPSGAGEVKISVVMCAHNAQQTLPTALDSVLAQSWRNLEVLVVDDASTDQTAALVQAYQGRDGRVRLLQNEQNLGAYGARNRAAREATGDFITVHDSDDWSHPQKLERQLAPLLENATLVASASYWVRVQEPFKVIGSWQLNQGLMELNPSSWLVRRSAFDRVGYWDSVRVEADTEFAQRLSLHFGHHALVTVVPEAPLAFARLEANTLTQQTATHLRTQFYGLRRLYAESMRWWHRQSSGRPVMPDATQRRPFPVPLGALTRGRPCVEQVVVANFALQDQPQLDGLLEKLDGLYRERGALCLLHWPDRTAWVGNTIADEVFAWAQSTGTSFAHPGLTLEATAVHVLQPLSLRECPAPTVLLPQVQTVWGAEGQLLEPQPSWLAYFREGGPAQ